MENEERNEEDARAETDRINQEFIEKWNGELIPNFGGASNGIGFTNYTDIIKAYLFDGQEAETE